MSELNLDDENVNYIEDNDSISRVYLSSGKRVGMNSDINSNNPNVESTGKKKKTRRSRIIISDPAEGMNDYYKKEVYDPDTRYKKSIFSAIGFNEYINTSRRAISKHFLKRKVKAAFEREPIEKSKGFNFNVPFIPNMTMFAAPQVNPQPPQVNVQSGRTGSAQNNPRIAQGDKNQNTGDIDKTVIISLNPSITDNISNKPGGQTRNLFNVNHTVPNHKVELNINTSVRPDQSKEVSAVSSSNLNVNTNINKHTPISNMSISSSSGSFGVTTGLGASTIPSPNSNSNNTGTSSSNNVNPSNFPSNLSQQEKMEMYKQQQQAKFKSYLDQYKKDPEKLKADIGEAEFNKFLSVLKTLQMKREMQQNRGQIPNNSNNNSAGNNTNSSGLSIPNNNFTPASTPSSTVVNSSQSVKPQLTNSNMQIISNNNSGGFTINSSVIQNFQKQGSKGSIPGESEEEKK